MAVDLVLADFAMPEMNGVELATAVRAPRPALPVILVTGHGGLDTLNEAGELQILQKPFSEGELEGKIRAALKKVDPLTDL